MKGHMVKRLILSLFRVAVLVALVTGLASIPVYLGPTAAYALDGISLHFKCYSVDERTKLEDQTVTILDQFNLIETPVKKPKFLCNPAIKNPVDSEVPAGPHLVCYDIDESREPFHDVDFFVGNQFGGQTVRVKETKLFCVPSCKDPTTPCTLDF